MESYHDITLDTSEPEMIDLSLSTERVLVQKNLVGSKNILDAGCGYVGVFGSADFEVSRGWRVLTL